MLRGSLSLGKGWTAPDRKIGEDEAKRMLSENPQHNVFMFNA